MEEGDRIPPSPAGFTRLPLQLRDRTLISSWCEYCGHHIIGTVPNIAQDEFEHRKACHNRAFKTDVAKAS